MTQAQTVKADYQFQNVLTSSVAGASALSPIGGGSASFVTDTIDGQSRTVYDFNAPSGLLVATTDLIAPDNYSLVLLAEIDTLSAAGVIPKLIDFKNLTSDAGLYTNSGGLLSFYDGAAMVTATGGSIQLGQYMSKLY